MKKTQKKTHIAVVVDRSGSMSSIRQQALDGLNEVINGFVKDGKLGGKTDVSVIQFDHEIEPFLEHVPVDMLPQFGAEDYEPRGTTALYDAVKHAIDTITDADETKDTAYLVTVISDGWENASKITQPEISGLIKDLESKGNWTFSFMLANQDIHKFVSTMGVSAGNVASFTATEQGTSVAFDSMVRASSNYLTARSVGNLQSLSTYSSPDNGVN